jgi:hypothetical protein
MSKVAIEKRNFFNKGFSQITTGITEHEELTQRKSNRPIECFVCMPWFCRFSVVWVAAFL